MTRLRAMRQADSETAATSGEFLPLDLSGFVGTWKSSDPMTHGIASLELTVVAGELRAQVYGAATGSEIDWGEVAAVSLYTDGVTFDTAAGFILDYAFGDTRSRLQANIKLGVVVLGVYRSFDDGSGRRSYFAREFLARSSGLRPPTKRGPIATAGGESIVALQDLEFGNHTELGSVDPAILLGRWHNTQVRSRGVLEITVERGDEGVALRFWGSGPEGLLDWGGAVGEVYACVEEDNVPSACVLARYDFGFMESEVQVRQNKGILAVTTFNRFRDSCRRDYVTRELYHRSEVR